jgi:hypothetical protein
VLGAAYLALVAGYALAWRTPARHPGIIAVGVVSNGLAAFVILSVGADGGFATWNALGLLYIWGSALLTAGLAVALIVTGQPLLRRISDRPRPGSVKVVGGRRRAGEQQLFEREALNVNYIVDVLQRPFYQ